VIFGRKQELDAIEAEKVAAVKAAIPGHKEPVDFGDEATKLLG
jgi:hypothetical protein